MILRTLLIFINILLIQFINIIYEKMIYIFKNIKNIKYIKNIKIEFYFCEL